jgi:hypothetical protein
MARPKDYCGSDVDPLDYTIKHEGTQPSVVLPKEGLRSLLDTMHQGGLCRSQKGKARLQGSLHLGFHSVPCLPTHSWKYCKK